MLLGWLMGFCAVVLGPLWQTFVSCLNVYELASIQGTQDSYTGLADSDGSDQSLEAFVIQVTPWCLTLIPLLSMVDSSVLWVTKKT
jgi:hypothetical protein